jgi:hypothetical protein
MENHLNLILLSSLAVALLILWAYVWRLAKENKGNRGAVGHPLGKIYQTQALAHASQFIEWCNRLSNPREREQATQIYTWAFWTHKGIFSAPEPSYAGLMICWLIERGCPKLTLSMVKYAFHISTMGDDHETEQ